MTKQVIESLLAKQGVKADGDTLAIPEEAAASVYISMGLEPLIVDRVASLKLTKDAVIVTTRRREQYLVAYEDVRAVRIADSERPVGY
jgi:hypothetical protein